MILDVGLSFAGIIYLLLAWSTARVMLRGTPYIFDVLLFLYWLGMSLLMITLVAADY